MKTDLLDGYKCPCGCHNDFSRLAAIEVFNDDNGATSLAFVGLCLRCQRIFFLL